MSDLLRRRAFLIGLMLVGFVIAGALLAGWVAPFDPIRSNYRNRLGAPTVVNPFGTDRFGRDVLSRILFGARITIALPPGSLPASCDFAGTHRRSRPT